MRAVLLLLKDLTIYSLMQRHKCYLIFIIVSFKFLVFKSPYEQMKNFNITCIDENQLLSNPMSLQDNSPKLSG